MTINQEYFFKNILFTLYTYFSGGILENEIVINESLQEDE
jgi:hypothetical protein